MKNMRIWTAGRCRNLGGYEKLHIHSALFSVRELATKRFNGAVVMSPARQTWVAWRYSDDPFADVTCLTWTCGLLLFHKGVGLVF